MRIRRGSRLWIAALAAGLPAAVALATPGASPPSSAAPTERLPVLAGQDLPELVSPAPTDAEWAGARAVRPNRGGTGPCSYRSLREWLDIRCKTLVGAGLVAGDPKGVVVRASGRMEDPADTRVTRVIVPIRRDEAKVFTFLAEQSEYSGSFAVQGGTLSIVWRAGRADPVLVTSGFGDGA